MKEEKSIKKRKISKKKVIVLSIIALLVMAIIGLLLWKFVFGKPKDKPTPKKPKTNNTEVVKEKVDIIDVKSQTRPLAISVNNTPVAVKVQTGLNKAYIVYEIPTEGSTSRLVALFKDVEDTKVGTIRSARHNMIDFALESDAIFTAYGWSTYAESNMRNGVIDSVQGIIGEGNMWRENPEHLSSEHTVYLQTAKIYDYAQNKKGYSLASDKTILLNYNVSDVDLSKREDAIPANNVTLPYGSVTTIFSYDPNVKMYSRVVNGTPALDYYTKEQFNTKNIIVQKITYYVMSDGHYWSLDTNGTGDGYYITNGYAVPIKWSKSDRRSKTKYTYLDGKEIEVSDGRTYIEVHVTSRNTTIE